MSVESPIISKQLKDYINSVGYNESELLKKNREETKKFGALSIMQIGAAQGAPICIIDNANRSSSRCSFIHNLQIMDKRAP